MAKSKIISKVSEIKVAFALIEASFRPAGDKEIEAWAKLKKFISELE